MTTNVAESLNGALNSYLPKRSVPFENGVESLYHFKRSRIESLIIFKTGKYLKSHRETLTRCVKRHQIMTSINQIDFNGKEPKESRDMGQGFVYIGFLFIIHFLVFGHIDQLKNLSSEVEEICRTKETFNTWASDWAAIHQQDRKYLGLDATTRKRGHTRTAAVALNISILEIEISDDE